MSESHGFAGSANAFDNLSEGDLAEIAPLILRAEGWDDVAEQLEDCMDRRGGTKR